ncbi:hypothetical protein ACHAW6_010445, partial [Cyclotella cf. meneghiniana]
APSPRRRRQRSIDNKRQRISPPDDLVSTDSIGINTDATSKQLLAAHVPTMGINGLLRNLHPLLVPPPTHHTRRNGHADSHIKIRHNIKQFASKSLAVDASSWLFKSAYTCADRLVEASERGVRDPVAEEKYTRYMIGRCRELLGAAQIAIIYLVFDGVRVPLKAGTNADREAKRMAHLAEARRLASLGRREEARERYNKCVKGTEEMARVVSAEVEKVWGTGEKARVKCVFSPYEADAQLAKLCVDGICHAVVTEDSDVLVYSATCRRPFPIIYKLDRKDGSCDVVTMDWLLNPKFLPPPNRTVNRRYQQEDEFEADEGSVQNKSRNSNRSISERDSKRKSAFERHCSEIDYGDDDNMMYAPIRRTLPLPLTSTSVSSSNNRARRSTAATKETGTGASLLTTLRSFAQKEAAHPGAGVRLFVQACVLSGCDYVPNRLSKVGPVTAFKLVKEASHRKPCERFDRVMKSLPNGSKLLSEMPEDDGANTEETKDNDHHGIFHSCECYGDMKEKYLELLSKSEAIFYYHYVKEQASGSIVPLVPLKSTGTDHHTPSLEHFNSDLSFIGSIEEATKNEPKAAPLCPRSQTGSPSHQNKSGLTNAKPPATIVKNTYKKQLLNQHETIGSGIRTPQKGTLQYSFNRSVLAYGAPARKRPSIAHHSLLVKTTETTRNHKSNLSPIPSALAKNQSILFSSFAHKSSELKHKLNPLQPQTSQKVVHNTKETKSPAVSPYISPMGRNSGFDYAEPLSSRKGSNTELFPSEYVTDKVDEVHCNTFGHNKDMEHIALSSPMKLSPKTDDIISLGAHMTPTMPREPEANVNINGDTFEYEIVIESPPIIPDQSIFEAHHPTYFQKGSPRRVSSSPHYGGSSPDDAIDLSDEPKSESPESSSEIFFDSKVATRLSLVNKRPFKSPYPNPENKPQNKFKTMGRKKARLASSGALLAGFAIQRDRDSKSTVSKGTQQRMVLRAEERKKPRSLSIKNYLKPPSLHRT